MEVILCCLDFAEKPVSTPKTSKKNTSPFEDYITGLREDSLLGSQGLIILSLCPRQSGCAARLVIKVFMSVVLQNLSF